MRLHKKYVQIIKKANLNNNHCNNTIIVLRYTFELRILFLKIYL